VQSVLYFLDTHPQECAKSHEVYSPTSCLGVFVAIIQISNFHSRILGQIEWSFISRPVRRLKSTIRSTWSVFELKTIHSNFKNNNDI